MVKRYDYDTLMYKLKKFNLINEAKLLVFVIKTKRYEQSTLHSS
jgi:hypothetical protein